MMRDIEHNEKETAVELPVTLHASKNVLGFLMGLSILIACGALYGAIRTGSVWFVLVLVFFSLVTAAFFRTLKNPMGLEVTEKGFVARSGAGLFRKKTPEMIPWAEIEKIGVLNQGPSYVAYQFTKESGRKQLPGGYIIPIVFEVPAEEVAMLLEGIRQTLSRPDVSATEFGE